MNVNPISESAPVRQESVRFNFAKGMLLKSHMPTKLSWKKTQMQNIAAFGLF